ncbi:MAG: rhomboid family intramembrane serine protease [Bacilli bacterium]|nr:rhomboid family intramembrane serine protease [Bacilli bacterium]
MSLTVNNRDEIIMRLVHYFVTEENYQPIIVNGVKNEIWLENLEAPYRIIRINSNYIHNNDQLIFDNYKVKSIAKQVKKKTLSFKVNILNILLDLNEDINIQEDKNIDTFNIKTLKDVRKDNGLSSLFPKLKTFTLNKENNVELIVNITNDINKKTEKNNINYENIFKPKKIIVTKVLIVINIMMFIFSVLYPNIFNLFFLNSDLVKTGDYWRLFTAAFLHANIIHLLVNMYSLYIIGTQVETFLGKKKFLIVYFGTAILASLMSAVITQGNSVGASGALFGLLGCLLYFGYHYRVYFGSVLTSQIIPVIVINLLIGFTVPMIDNAAHIGGLIGGVFLTMAIGVGKKDDKATMINGTIVSFIYMAFLAYLLFLN